MNVNLEKSLESKKREAIKEDVNNPLKDIKLLLENNHQEDIRILRNLSPYTGVNELERDLGKKIELEKFDKDYSGKVYHIDQIKNLAIDYKLRFLRTKYFKGNFEATVVSEIKKFADSVTSITLDDYTLKHKFYVLAPESMFHLERKDYETTAAKRRRLLREDPILFYQINDNHYRLIKKWGSDFTIFRYLVGFRWKSYNHHWLFNIALMLPIVGFLLTLVLSPLFIHEHPIFTGAFIVSLSALFAHLLYGFWKLDNDKPIPGYFTNDNWNSNEKINVLR